MTDASETAGALDGLFVLDLTPHSRRTNRHANAG